MSLPADAVRQLEIIKATIERLAGNPNGSDDHDGTEG